MSELHSADTESAGRPARKAGLTAWIYSDYTVAAFILAFCAFVYFLTTRIIKVPPALAQGIQPSSYPQGVLFFILIFTGMMLFEGRRRRPDIPEPIPRLAYYTTAAMVGSLLIATSVDFFLGLILFIMICVPLWGMRRPFVALLFGVALCAAMYALFAEGLQVRFPRGVVTDLLR